MPGMKKTMSEWKSSDLHSGSKHGPIVKSQAQAVAIGLSEARKAGERVAKAPKMKHEPTAPGRMGSMHDHHVEQGHKMKGHERKNDGAGRHGHDESGHRAYSEHAAPRHPESGHGGHKSTHHETDHAAGAFGYPGKTMEMDHEHQLVGGNYSQTMHEPAVLKTPDGQGFTAGHQGISAGMGKQPSGYGHQQHQRDGVHRLSGAPNAHRIGKRK